MNLPFFWLQELPNKLLWIPVTQETHSFPHGCTKIDRYYAGNSAGFIAVTDNSMELTYYVREEGWHTVIDGDLYQQILDEVQHEEGYPTQDTEGFKDECSWWMRRLGLWLIWEALFIKFEGRVEPPDLEPDQPTLDDIEWSDDPEESGGENIILPFPKPH